MVLQVLADAGQIGDRFDPERLELGRIADAESCSSCGELNAPPQRITSPARIVSDPTRTPTARVPSKTTVVDEGARAHL